MPCCNMKHTMTGKCCFCQDYFLKEPSYLCIGLLTLFWCVWRMRCVICAVLFQRCCPKWWNNDHSSKNKGWESGSVAWINDHRRLLTLRISFLVGPVAMNCVPQCALSGLSVTQLNGEEGLERMRGGSAVLVVVTSVQQHYKRRDTSSALHSPRTHWPFSLLIFLSVVVSALNGCALRQLISPVNTEILMRGVWFVVSAPACLTSTAFYLS